MTAFVPFSKLFRQWGVTDAEMKIDLQVLPIWPGIQHLHSTIEKGQNVVFLCCANCLEFCSSNFFRPGSFHFIFPHFLQV